MGMSSEFSASKIMPGRGAIKKKRHEYNKKSYSLHGKMKKGHAEMACPLRKRREVWQLKGKTY